MASMVSGQASAHMEHRTRPQLLCCCRQDRRNLRSSTQLYSATRAYEIHARCECRAGSPLVRAIVPIHAHGHDQRVRLCIQRWLPGREIREMHPTSSGRSTVFPWGGGRSSTHCSHSTAGLRSLISIGHAKVNELFLFEPEGRGWVCTNGTIYNDQNF